MTEKYETVAALIEAIPEAEGVVRAIEEVAAENPVLALETADRLEGAIPILEAVSAYRAKFGTEATEEMIDLLRTKDNESVAANTPLLVAHARQKVSEAHADRKGERI